MSTTEIKRSAYVRDIVQLEEDEQRAEIRQLFVDLLDATEQSALEDRVRAALDAFISHIDVPRSMQNVKFILGRLSTEEWQIAHEGLCRHCGSPTPCHCENDE